jgi:ABC-type spermidine/putrescine transport system permease subunit I
MNAIASPTSAATVAPATGRRRGFSPLWLGAPIVLLLVTLLVYPVAQLLLLSIHNDNGFTFAAYQRLFASSVYLNVLWITLKVSLWTTVLAVVGAYPIAYLISSLPQKQKSSLLFWVLLSFWSSFLVRAFAWIVMLGRNGVVNKTLQALGVTDAPISLLYSFGSTLVGMVHALMPLAVLTMLSVMDNINRNLPRAALTLGARPGTAFWKVYFPLSMPGVAAASIMVFVTAIGFFIFPALLGGRRETMISQIIIDQVQQTLDWGFAGAVSVLLLVVVLVVFALYDRLLGLSTMTGGASERRKTASRGPAKAAGDAVLTVLGKASDALLGLVPRAKTARAGEPGRSAGMKGLVWLLLAFLSVPTVLMIPLSFAGQSGLNWPPRGFSLQWYQQMYDSPLWMQALTRSIVVGLGSSALAMIVGTPAAFLLARATLRGKGLMLALVLSPLIVPRMIIAIGLFYLFSKVNLVGTSMGLILGHTLVTTPYVVMTMMAVLRNYDTRLDLAASSLGARPWQTLRHVTLPILKTGMLSSFLFAFATSFDELTIALFSSGGLNATLPKQFWDEVVLQISPVIAAVSTCLFVFVAALIWIAERLRRGARTA